MKNPWIELASGHGIDEYILKAELPIINAFNERQKFIGDNDYYKYHIHKEILPAPFMGDVHNAPVVLLTLNPGWDDEECRNGFYTKYSDYWLKMLNHDFPIPDLPLFCLDEKYAEFSPYWANKFKPLIAQTSKSAVAQQISVIQFFPYQSKMYKGMYKRLNDGYLESQRYNFDLVKAAIDRGALIVVLRSRKLWEEAVCQLKGYPRVRFTKNPRNPMLSEKNLGETFHEIIELIRCVNDLS